MSKFNFKCVDCDYEASKWLGKCPRCNNWNTMAENDLTKKVTVKSCLDKLEFLNKIKILESENIKTYIEEFDKVVGDGLTRGSLVLLGGQPGVGKSTLVMSVANAVAKQNNQRVLYVSGEENSGQIQKRASRLNIDNDKIGILIENNLQTIIEYTNHYKPTLVIIDSIQTTYSSELSATPGSINQLREVTHELLKDYKKKNVTLIIIGHVTKDGEIAGPKFLEHMVDSVIYFEKNESNENRILRVKKNRFGSTDEVGFFKMQKNGLKELGPDEFKLNFDNNKKVGCSYSCIVEGKRIFLVNVEALVVENKDGYGQRSVIGYELNRVKMLLGIIDKYLGIDLSYYNVYINVRSDVKQQQKHLDLSIVMSILSSYYNKLQKESYLLFGEISLSGEINPYKYLNHIENNQLLTTTENIIAKNSTSSCMKKIDDMIALFY